MRRLLRKLDWSSGDNLIQCFAGASRQATDGALSIRRRIPRSGLVHSPTAAAALRPQRGMKTAASRAFRDARANVQSLVNMYLKSRSFRRTEKGLLGFAAPNRGEQREPVRRGIEQTFFSHTV